MHEVLVDLYTHRRALTSFFRRVHMGSTNLAALTASDAAKAIRDGRVTSEELVAACLERVREREEDVQAWVHIDPEHALAQARAADAARREGKGVGPLNGIPIGIKDIIDTADMPTQHGSDIFKGRQADADASCVAALRQAGAVIMGKTVTTELATLTPSKTRNPHNLAHTPGGSSSGSAAAVAAGMVPAALGTQTGGSVIRPASFCGVVGFKPTVGLIPRKGVLLQSHTLDTVGVFGRSVEDVALVADCLTRHDTEDTASYPRSRPNLYATAIEEVPVPPLFVFIKTPAWDLASEVTKEAFAELIDELGNKVQQIEVPSLERAIAWQRMVQAAENAAYYGPLLERAPDRISRGLRERIERGARAPVAEYIKALAGRDSVYSVLEEVFFGYSAIVTPAAPGPAPAGYATTGDPVFNGMWTYLGVPAVTLPLMAAEGLPIGVQLVGARRDDGRLLRTARWLHDHLAKG
jgi:Asp-tRNA(Asn)/Glu-tRNA(Gln) amidotransferase A subunit family amidase